MNSLASKILPALLSLWLGACGGSDDAQPIDVRSPAVADPVRNPSADPSPPSVALAASSPQPVTRLGGPPPP